MTEPARFPVLTTRTVVAGGVMWCLSVVFFVVLPIARIASQRPYDLSTDLISDLGVTDCGPVICSPLHTLVNATFVVTGLCHMIGAVLTRTAFPRPDLVRVAMVLLELAGVGLVTAGLNPENLSGTVHGIAAVAGLVCLNLAVVVYGFLVRPDRKWLGAMTRGAGVVGLVGLTLFLAAPGIPRGISERVADYPAVAMVIVLGGAILSAARSSSGHAHAAAR